VGIVVLQSTYAIYSQTTQNMRKKRKSSNIYFGGNAYFDRGELMSRFLPPRQQVCVAELKLDHLVENKIDTVANP